MWAGRRVRYPRCHKHLLEEDALLMSAVGLRQQICAPDGLEQATSKPCDDLRLRRLPPSRSRSLRFTLLPLPPLPPPRRSLFLRAHAAPSLGFVTEQLFLNRTNTARRTPFTPTGRTPRTPVPSIHHPPPNPLRPPPRGPQRTRPSTHDVDERRRARPALLLGRARVLRDRPLASTLANPPPLPAPAPAPPGAHAGPHEPGPAHPDDRAALRAVAVD